MSRLIEKFFCAKGAAATGRLVAGDEKKGAERFHPAKLRGMGRRSLDAGRRVHPAKSAGWRRVRRSECGRKSRPALLEMTVAGWVHLGRSLGDTPEGAEAGLVAIELVAVAPAPAGDGIVLRTH